MEDQDLSQREAAITSSHREFLAKVRNAFNVHCDEIKAQAISKFNAIPTADQPGRKKVLTEQKADLDKTLTELKQLLTKQGNEVRGHLEEIANLRDQQSFDLDTELAVVEKVDVKKHAA